jgi:hypothetical protein
VDQYEPDNILARIQFSQQNVTERTEALNDEVENLIRIIRGNGTV